MTRRHELLVSPLTSHAKWQLSLPERAPRWLIGWRLASGRSVDDGVPPVVAAVLARALTDLGWVSFFEGSPPRGALGDRVHPIEPAGILGRIGAAVAGFPRAVWWVSTRRPELAASAFDADYFFWHTQGQAVVVSPGDREPPLFDWARMRALTGGEEAALAAALSAWGALAIVRPGVDGALAGLVAASEIVREHALASLRGAAASLDVELRVLSERELEEALSDEHRPRADTQRRSRRVVDVAIGEGSPMLRDVLESDLPIFFEQQRDTVALEMASVPSHELAAFLSHWRTRVLGDPTARMRTIVVDGGVAGNIGSWGAEGRRCVGYWIGREHWGRGVATAALAEFLKEEATRPLYAQVAARNVASIRVLHKCGFRQLGGVERAPDGVEECCFVLGAPPSASG